MNTKNILNNFLGNVKKEQNSYKPKKFKPLREMTIADKPVQIFNNHPIPKKSVIEKVYDKIPDDTNIPLQFMTREQYVKKYVKNQELANGQGFDKQIKQEFFDYKKDKYANIVGRYTTKNNSFYEPAVIIFNDPENQSNIKGKKFKELAWHEYGHELVEQKQIEMCELTEEEFADYLAEEMVHNNQDCPKKVLKTFLKNRNI